MILYVENPKEPTKNIKMNKQDWRIQDQYPKINLISVIWK